MNDPNKLMVEELDTDEGDPLEEAAKAAAMKFAMGQELTEEEWADLHDFACDVLQEMDGGFVTDDDLPF